MVSDKGSAEYKAFANSLMCNYKQQFNEHLDLLHHILMVFLEDPQIKNDWKPLLLLSKIAPSIAHARTHMSPVPKSHIHTHTYTHARKHTHTHAQYTHTYTKATREREVREGRGTPLCKCNDHIYLFDVVYFPTYALTPFLSFSELQPFKIYFRVYRMLFNFFHPL